ncbi:SRPBCC family protein [Streptomyces sp. NPDC002574]|uniref:SRPBCC family protein n=1 Tax=Streptomyces sp. NPDC002574 TaxID=3364652 RepID=UPI00367777D3
MTTTFHVERESPLSPAEAWRRVTDWERHAAHVPLTTVVRDGDTGFTARTGIGPLSFADPMEIVRWEPPDAGGGPGRCRLEKRGAVVLGWAEIEVWPSDPGPGSRIVWREDLRVRGLPKAFGRPTAWAGRRVFGRALDALLAGEPR